MRILLIEDSLTLLRTVSATLRRSGFAVDTSADGEDGLWHATTIDYDAIVLDILLPRLDGLSVLARSRAMGLNTPILLLTARNAVEDRVRGLNAGADDYLCKPFSLDELLARVRALVRRRLGQSAPALEIDGLRVDRNRCAADFRGEPISLTPREFALLDYLVGRSGSVVSQSEIERHIYDELVEPASNVVPSAICLLRRKLAAAGAADLIQTRRGHGYIFQSAEPD